MKLISLTWVFMVVLTAASVTLAQDQTVHEASPAPVAPIWKVIKVAGKAIARHEGRTNTIFVTSGPVEFFNNDRGWGQLSANFNNNGDKVLRPASVKLQVYIAAKDHELVADQRIKIVADKTGMIDQKASLIKALTKGFDTYASLIIELPYNDFRKMAMAKKMSLYVGQQRFDLTREKFSGFKDLVYIAEGTGDSIAGSPAKSWREN
jgi:hypothetical protein